MERAIDNALLEKVLTYIPFVVYDGKARSFVLCVHRGYVDATGLGLEHQHVRFAKLLSAVVKGQDIQAAWEALEHSERQALHLACPEMTIVETDCSVLKTRLSSNTEVHQLVAFFQFVAYEGHCDMALIGRTWRVLQLVAAAVKGGTRALQWTTKAWQRLTTEEQDSWTRQFGPLGHEPKEMKKQLKTFCSRYVDDHPYLDDLAICEKHYDLLAFHALVQKTIGSVPKMTQIPGVTWATRRALKAIVDKDNVPFPLAVVALVVDDGDVVSALRDYLGYWRGKESNAVFKKWDGEFWQGKPAAVFYITSVIQRHARLKSSHVRLVQLDQAKQGECCPCRTAALYCKDCLELKSIPNFCHPPPGRSIAFDINADRVVCQMCKSTRVIQVPLLNPLNPSTTLSISHPDRSPLHICNGSPFCFTKTSHVGSCRACEG